MTPRPRRPQPTRAQILAAVETVLDAALLPVTLREDEWTRRVLDVALLARAGQGVGAELKTQRSRVRPEQQVWRPSDVAAVLARLAEVRADRPPLTPPPPREIR